MNNREKWLCRLIGSTNFKIKFIFVMEANEILLGSETKENYLYKQNSINLKLNINLFFYGYKKNVIFSKIINVENIRLYSALRS